MLSIWPKQPTGPIRFCFQSVKFPFLYLFPVISAGFFVHTLWQRRSSPVKAHSYVHLFVSGNHQLCSLLYAVRQLHHVCRVDAEEDVQDFGQLFGKSRSAAPSNIELMKTITSENTYLRFISRPWQLHFPCYHPASLTPILRDQSNSSDKEL